MRAFAAGLALLVLVACGTASVQPAAESQSIYPSPGPSGCHDWEPGCNELGVCKWRVDEPLPCGKGVEKDKAYGFRLFTHCGIQSAWFDGREWHADPVVPPGAWTPEPHSNNTTEGTLTLVANDEAHFEGAIGLTATFRSGPPASPSYCA